MKNLREEAPPTPVTPAKAGVQRNMCLEEAQYLLASVALK